VFDVSTRSRGSTYYPVFLNIYKRQCVVVGGGKVALRKVERFLEQGAIVQVIAPNLCPEVNRLAMNRAINVVRRNYEVGDLKEAYIAIAASTDTDTNRRTAIEAKSQGILVNVVDDSEQSDFITPSCLRRGELTIAISTAGRSPALARKIRARLEKDFGEEYASLVTMIGEVRSQLKEEGVTVNESVWQKALNLDPLIRMIRSGQAEKAKTTMINNLEREIKAEQVV